MPTMGQNVSQHESTNPSHASEDTKCIPACIDQTDPMPPTKYVSLTCVDQSHSMPERKTKCISTCVDKTYSMPAKT